MEPWIGVDLDGTLAHYDGFKGPDVIGDPVIGMVERIHAWKRAGIKMKIFTARVCHDGTDKRRAEAKTAELAIMDWTAKIFGEPLEVTNIKDYGMVELWDDRAVTVRANTGIAMADSPANLDPFNMRPTIKVKEKR